MWPPRRPSGRSGRSRFTGAPGVRTPRLDLPSVSPITSALNSPSRVPVTVRHTPLIAIESPSGCVAGNQRARGLVSRAESPLISMPTTSPSSSTIPVNTVSSSGASVPTGALPCLGLRGCAKSANADLPPDRTLRLRARPLTAHVLPPIRTFTVGPGISPGQPADGLGRVADYHRRFGISPTPEHACLRELVCHARYSAVPW